MTMLAVTLGDPAGIGPEVVAKAWDQRDSHALPPFFAIGDAASVRAVWHGPIAEIAEPAQARDAIAAALPILRQAPETSCDHNIPSIEGAKIALSALKTGIALAKSGGATGLVTGPVSKAQLYKIGFNFPGQTEYVANQCGFEAGQVAMMLAGPSLRVVPATIHMPLCKAIASLTSEMIISQAQILASDLTRLFGIVHPKIAVAGLNPHAGEDGALGDEEITIIGPAVSALKALGLDVTGPISPDSLFTPRARKKYDAALCMYHDQALIPLKALHVDDGVNITLGLPIIRTSPDHGTAFEIAGQNMADPGAMIAAIRMAAMAAENLAKAKA